MKPWARATLWTTLALVGACVVNPATNRLQLSLISESQEIRLGEQTAQEVTASIGLVDQPALQRYVADIGHELAARSERPGLPWTFAVVDDASANAFALPGGKIFITRGLVAHLDNEAQLASVLGHEIGHITARHSVRRISQAQVAELGFGIGAMLSPQLRQMAPLVGAGLNLLFLSFSRRDEHQADELGIRYAYRAEYDVAEMAEVFRILETVSEAQNGGRLPQWLATHPSPENRIGRTLERVALVEDQRHRLSVEERPYLRQLDGLAYGPDPRTGFFSNGHYVHPELRFSLTFPPQWPTANLRDAAIAASPEQDARTQVSVTAAGSVEQALQAFSAQAPVRLLAQQRGLVPGLSSLTASFTANVREGNLAGLVSYVALDRRIIQILSFTQAARASTYAPTFERTHASFSRVTDPQLVGIQPARIRILRVPEATTLRTLYDARRPEITLDALVLLNRWSADEPLSAGQPVKWVEGGPPLERL